MPKTTKYFAISDFNCTLTNDGYSLTSPSHYIEFSIQLSKNELPDYSVVSEALISFDFSHRPYNLNGVKPYLVDGQKKYRLIIHMLIKM